MSIIVQEYLEQIKESLYKKSLKRVEKVILEKTNDNMLYYTYSNVNDLIEFKYNNQYIVFLKILKML